MTDDPRTDAPDILNRVHEVLAAADAGGWDVHPDYLRATLERIAELEAMGSLRENRTLVAENRKLRDALRDIEEHAQRRSPIWVQQQVRAALAATEEPEQ